MSPAVPTTGTTVIVQSMEVPSSIEGAVDTGRVSSVSPGPSVVGTVGSIVVVDVEATSPVSMVVVGVAAVTVVDVATTVVEVAGATVVVGGTVVVVEVTVVGEGIVLGDEGAVDEGSLPHATVVSVVTAKMTETVTRARYMYLMLRR